MEDLGPWIPWIVVAVAVWLCSRGGGDDGRPRPPRRPFPDDDTRFERGYGTQWTDGDAP